DIDSFDTDVGDTACLRDARMVCPQRCQAGTRAVPLNDSMRSRCRSELPCRNCLGVMAVNRRNAWKKFFLLRYPISNEITSTLSSVSASRFKASMSRTLCRYARQVTPYSRAKSRRKIDAVVARTFANRARSQCSGYCPRSRVAARCANDGG